MNESDLTKLRIRVAELCGWKVVETSDRFELHAPDGRKWKQFWSCEIAWTANCIPDYPNDLNACHEFEKIMSDEEFGQYENELKVAVWRGKNGIAFSNREVSAIHATAEQRCRAFVATMEGQSVQTRNDSKQ